MNQQTKYFLTYDFQLIYQATALLKIFDANTGSFRTLDIYKDFNHQAYEIPTQAVGDMITTLYREPIGFELNKDKMKWIEEFEIKLNENSKILRNRSLVFNYMILKLLLAGFKEKDAKNFIISYFSSEIIDVSVAEMIEKINEILERKQYWVLNDIQRERNILRNFILTILKEKLKNSHNFSFEKFRAEDKVLCNRLILPKLIKFNSIKNYLVKVPKELTSQKNHLILVYKMFLQDILASVINEDLPAYHFEDFFLNNIISEMIKDADDYLKILELNPEYYQ